jgi:hypothetical protein
MRLEHTYFPLVASFCMPFETFEAERVWHKAGRLLFSKENFQAWKQGMFGMRPAYQVNNAHYHNFRQRAADVLILRLDGRWVCCNEMEKARGQKDHIHT